MDGLTPRLVRASIACSLPRSGIEPIVPPLPRGTHELCSPLFLSLRAYRYTRCSWNTDWGEKGYIRVALGENACGIADEPTTVTI